MENETAVVRVVTYVSVKVRPDSDPTDDAYEYVLENSNWDFAKSCDYEELVD